MKNKWYIAVDYGYAISDVYNVALFDDVRPEHKEDVAMLMAAVESVEFDRLSEIRVASIDGIGEIRDYRFTGPYIRLRKDF